MVLFYHSESFASRFAILTHSVFEFLDGGKIFVDDFRSDTAKVHFTDVVSFHEVMGMC